MRYVLPPGLYNALQRLVHGDYDVQRRLIRDFVAGESGVAIEIGCGTGLLSRFFEAGSYVGVDTDVDRIEKARAAHPEHRFEVLDPTATEIGDLERFDFVLCSNFVHHIDDAAVTGIVEAFRRAAAARNKPVQFLLMEPVLPDRIWRNIPGYILAKMDRGLYVRTIGEMKALFGDWVTSLERVKGPWFWPVPGVAMTLSVR